MSHLAPANLTKLAKICAMFSSTYDGERAAAAALADRIVRGSGITWEQLLQPLPPKPETSRRREVGLTPGEILAQHGGDLTGWAKGFLVSLMRQQRHRWSARQVEVLNDIRGRVSGATR